jgi:hypothetical protein
MTATPQPVARETSGRLSPMRVTLPIALVLALVSGGGSGLLANRADNGRHTRRMDQLEAKLDKANEEIGSLRVQRGRAEQLDSEILRRLERLDGKLDELLSRPMARRRRGLVRPLIALLVLTGCALPGEVQTSPVGSVDASEPLAQRQTARWPPRTDAAPAIVDLSAPSPDIPPYQPGLPAGAPCTTDDDCYDYWCHCGTCQPFEWPASCRNGLMDGDESWIDCGGSCPPCARLEFCRAGPDCYNCRCYWCTYPGYVLQQCGCP